MSEFHCGDDMELFYRRLPIQRGNGMMPDGRMYFGGVRRMRGAGIGGIFGSIARSLIPFARKYLVPHALDMAKNVVNDVSEGKKIGDSLKKNATRALNNAGKSYFTNQSGSGVSRRRTSTKRSKVAKRKQTRKKRPAKRVQKKRNRTKAKVARRKRKSKTPLNTIFH